MTAKELARAVWPYINDEKRQRAVIAMDEGRVFTYIPEGMDYRLIAQNFTHALMAILEGGMDTRKAMETAISALVAEALKMQGGRDEMPRKLHRSPRLLHRRELPSCRAGKVP